MTHSNTIPKKELFYYKHSSELELLYNIFTYMQDILHLTTFWHLSPATSIQDLYTAHLQYIWGLFFFIKEESSISKPKATYFLESENW